MNFRWDATTIEQFQRAIAQYHALIIVISVTVTTMIVVGIFMLFAYFNGIGGQWWLVALSWIIIGGFAIHLNRLVNHRNKLIRKLVANSLCPIRQPGQRAIRVQESHGNNDTTEGQQQPSG